MRRCVWIAATAVVLSACTASWNRVVQYSNAPAPAGADTEEGVYEAALSRLMSENGDSAIVRSFWSVDSNAPHDIWASTQVPAFWADTVKRELYHALSAPALWTGADSVRLARVATGRRLTLIWRLKDDPVHPVKLTGGNVGRAIPSIAMSRPGFNADSTIAAIRVSILCGPMCGSGETLFLARHPGAKWRVWGGHTEWVS